MKRAWKLLSLALVVVLLLSVTALADGTVENDKATITVKGAGVTATFDEANPDVIQVTVTGANLTAGSQYVVLMVKSADGTNYSITNDSILYIDQTAAIDAGSGTGKISFSVYPSSLQDSVILIAGAGVNGETGPLVAAIVEAKYILGDLSGDQKVSVTDALLLLQYLAGSTKLNDTQLIAADANHSGNVTVTDALVILQYLAGTGTLK